jgi:hypothetical protein
MPLNHAGTEPAGLSLAPGAHCDFEIAVGYELLTAAPSLGRGVGFELYLMLETPVADALAFMRVKRPDGKDHFAGNYLKTVDGKRRGIQKVAPALAASGQLQISRRGTKFTCAAADGPGGDLRELFSYDGDAADVRMIRIAAYPGQSAAEVEVRLLDFRLRADHLKPELIAALDAPAPVPPAGGRLWLTLAVLIALAICLALVVTAILMFLGRRRPGMTIPPGNATPNRRSAAPADGAISLPCSVCGKSLNVKPELAGKKVKCPHCGGATVVATAVKPRDEPSPK